MEEPMSVRVRAQKNRENIIVSWQADIHVKLIDGRNIRERVRVPAATSESSALKWARERERWLVLHGHEQQPKKETGAPTLAEFCQRWMAEYVVANRLKPSTTYNKDLIIKCYLVPTLGDRPIDTITESDVQRLKVRFVSQRASSVNNILTCLSTILKSAVEWGVIAAAPRIRKLRKDPDRFDFYEDEVYERLVAASLSVDERAYVVVLLGGEAGLRAGEMLALRWDHCDLARGALRVVENEWRGHRGTPKGNRTRQIVMTARLREALTDLRRRSGNTQRVLRRDDGSAPGKRVLDGWLAIAQRSAGLPTKGPHVLRHTFCSRLAARGAAPKAIQELAGHVHSSTTDRYLHLAPSALQTAIGLLDPAAVGPAGAERGEVTPRAVARSRHEQLRP